MNQVDVSIQEVCAEQKTLSFYIREYGYLYAVFAAAFLIRLLHLNSYTSYPGFDLPLGGHAAYVKIAYKILDGDLLGGDQIFYDNSPVYSYILAMLFKVFGVDFYAVRFVQILIGSINCALIGWIAKQYFTPLVGTVSGLIAAGYGPFIFYDGEIIVLSWVILFCLIAMIPFVLNMKYSFTNMLISGFFMGASVMGRPNLIIYPLCMIPFILLVASPSSNKILPRLRACMALLLGVIVIPALFGIRNYAVSGEVLLLNPSGGHNFYFGHHRGAGPVFNEKLLFKGPILEKYKQIAEEELKRPLSAKQVSNFWYKKGIEFIISHPMEELKLIGEKTLFFLNDVEIPTYFNYYFNRDFSTVLKKWPITFGAILPLSILGFLTTLNQRKTFIPLYLFFFTTFLTVQIIFVISRVRIPAIPVVIIFAASGLVTLTDWIKYKALKPISLGLALIAFFSWISFTPFIQLNFADPHNQLGVVYWTKKNIPEAEKSFLNALALDSAFEYPLLNLINMFKEQGNEDKAKEYARQYLAMKIEHKNQVSP